MATLVEVVKHGSVLHVDAAVQKLSGQVNKPNSSDVYPLHLAVWRNHLPIIERLLEVGAWTHCTDGESGWTPLHRALYLGHLAAAAKLLQAGASLDVNDLQSRTPVDLVSAELRHMPTEGAGRCSSIYSWGNGANYQLGTGSNDFHLNPLRVEALQGLGVAAVVAAKFHSAALTADGRLLTWGWGRGGRLGHPDFNIHSGEGALIHPWQVSGLGRRVVVSVAAGKHHMVVATSTGDIWSWGGNRDGKLGYPNVDTQPTPRKVEFRGRAVMVAASNRHSACLTTAGEVWTWGSNNDGQLGYGTTNAANSPTPRVVEAMKGKVLVALSLAKRHTVVLSADGDAFTWGHRMVTPRRVPLAGSRDTARLAAVQLQQQQAGGAGSGSAVAGTGGTVAPPPLPLAAAAGGLDVRFHRNHTEVIRPEAALVAAGYSHTTVVTRSGEVLCWRSADPALRPQEVLGPLAGKRVVAVGAGKTRTVVVTDTGQVYMWERKEKLQRAMGGSGAGSGAGAGATPSGSATSKSVDVQGGTVTAALMGRNAAMTGGSGGGGGGGGGGSGGAGAGVGGGGALAAAATVSVAGMTNGSGGVGSGATTAPIYGIMGVGDEATSIVPVRVPGLTRVIQVAVGEKHTLALQAWTLPPMPDEQGIMPTAGRRRHKRFSDGSGDSQSSGSEDDPFEGTGGWWQVRGKSIHSIRAAGGGAGAGSGAATSTAGSLTRGGSGLSPSIGPGVGPTPPLGSSPMGRSLGYGAEMIPSPVPTGSGIATAAAGSLMGMYLRGERRRDAVASAAEMARDQRGPGWELFSHRPAATGVCLNVPSPRRHRWRSSADGQASFPDDDGDDMFGFVDGDGCPVTPHGLGSDGGAGSGLVPSLQVLCQRVVAAQLVEPRTTLPLLEYADVAGAMLLRCYCLAVAIANLDCTLLEAPGGLTGLPPHLLAELEHLYRAALLVPPPSAHPLTAPGASPGRPSNGAALTDTSSGVLGSSPPSNGLAPYGSALGGGGSGSGYESQLAALEALHRRRLLIARLQPGRRPTAAPAWLEGAAATDRMAPQASSRLGAAALAALCAIRHGARGCQAALATTEGSAGSMAADLVTGGTGGGNGETGSEVQRMVRSLQRKLEQIANLEDLQRGGRQLDAQQHAKLSQKGALQEALLALAAGAHVESVKQAIAHSAEVASKLAARPDAAPAAAAGTQPTQPTAGVFSNVGAGGSRTGGVARSSVAPSPSQSAQQQQQQQQQQLCSSGGSGRKRGMKEATAAAAAITAGGLSEAGTPGGASTLTATCSAAENTASATTVYSSVLPAGEGKSLFTSQPASGGINSVSTGMTSGPGTPIATIMASAVAGSGTGSSKKQQQRRGALSMFLSGALDQPLSPPPVLSTPPASTAAAPKGPAWGGAKPPSASAAGSSLRELLSQQQQQQQMQAGAAAAPSRSSSGLGQGTGQAMQSFPTRTPSGPLPLPLPAATGPSASSFPIAAAAGATPSGRKLTSSPFLATAAKAVGSSPAIGSGVGSTGLSVSPIVASASVGGNGGGVGAGSGSVKLTLAEFMSSKPITAPLQMTGQRGRELEREKEPAGPAWGGVQGGSPAAAKSLLDIQAEQAQVQKRVAAGWVKPVPNGLAGAQAPSVAASTSGVSAAVAASSATPTGSSPPSRSLMLGPTQGGTPSQQQPSKWYIPEECQPAMATKALTAIQTEERAIKEITARYGGKVVARVVSHGQSDAAATVPAKPTGKDVAGTRTNSAASAAMGPVAVPPSGGGSAQRSKQKAAKGNLS